MKKILIIDDDARYRQVMGDLLQLQGWQVLEAEEGESGLEMVRRHRPEIVLCDLLMPRCNGFHVCRAIRGDITLRRTKIVVSSARDYEADRLAAREAGADEYITKPVNPRDLEGVLERLGATMRQGNIRSPVEPADRSPARIKFWGVRGSIPTPGPGTVRYGGNTSCVEYRAGGEIIILDAGTGMRNLGRELMSEFKGRPFNLTLLLSHTHWDHIQGLPFFGPLYEQDCRLRIYGYEGAREGLLHVLSGQMESPYFPIPFGELPGGIEIEELRDMRVQVGSVVVDALFANHPGICVGYRLSTSESSMAFFPDSEPRCRYRNGVAVASANPKTSLEFARTEEQKLIEFLRGIDALVMDAQYTAEEYDQHVGWGHGCVDDAVALALKSNVRQLFLFHHDPDHNDNQVEAMLEHARMLVSQQGGALQVDAAREGAIVELAQIPKRKTGT
jgi:phosphoribosyl 1,2-cyclic phosphodiesterase/ActR/RegA family two-component response regulator